MRASLLSSTLVSLVTLGRPTLIEGSPGLGKTEIVRQVANTMGIGFIHLHAPLMQPEDYGMPVVNADRTGVNFVVPNRFPMVGHDTPDTGILLIDELPQADNSGQKILANLLQERELHGKRMKPGWVPIATGNKATDRAGANRILSHLSNRVTRITFEPNLDDWCSWAIDHGVDPGIISFLRFKPALLHDFKPDQDSSPTPRAWVEGVSPMIDNVPKEAEMECFSGAVGEGAAAEFVAFLKIMRKLPNPDSVLLRPKEAVVPNDPATLYAISGAIAMRATEDNFEAVVTYAKRLPPEFMTLVMRDSMRRCEGVTRTRYFTEWASKEGAKVLL